MGPAPPAPANQYQYQYQSLPQFGSIVPQPLPVPIEETEQWNRWRELNHNPFTQKAIRERRHRNFYEYKATTGEIVPKFQHHYVATTVQQPRRRRGRLSRSRVEEVAYRRPHPHTEHQDETLSNLFRQHVFARTNDRSEQARIGEYVQLDIAPQVLYIKVAKGAQEEAIRILTSRLYEHIQSAVTRLFLKQSTRTGRYTYSLWLSARTLQAMSESDLFERIRKITKGMTKPVTIIVKQNISSGSIQELWSKKHTLL
jgi:hypothetical protein